MFSVCFSDPSSDPVVWVVVLSEVTRGEKLPGFISSGLKAGSTGPSGIQFGLGGLLSHPVLFEAHEWLGP
jgi:hypothetical protein